MTFTPILPFTGVGGYQFLLSTEERQREAAANDVEVAREVAYFRENIAKITSAEQLLADRRLLEVAMTAYGLEDELGKDALIQQALEGGTDDPSSFANSLSDTRWAELAGGFGFGDADTGFEVGRFQAAVELRFRDQTGSTSSTLSAFDLAHFRTNIGSITTVDELLADTLTLDVALKAFGLERGFYNDNHFRQLLLEGTDDTVNDYAYTLDESAWVDFTKAFEGLQTGSITQVDQFGLDVERELARRGLGVVSSQATADASSSLISEADRDYFVANIGSTADAAALVGDATMKKVVLVAYDLTGETISDADLIAVLNGGSGAGSPAAQQSNGRFLQLAESFAKFGTTTPSFDRDVELKIAQNSLEFVPGIDEPPPTAPEIDQADLDYFTANIGRIETSAQLVADERLLTVALTAFGLENEGRSASFIQSILDEDPYNANSFVNIISDTRWRDFAQAFTPDPNASDDFGSLAPDLMQYALEERLIALGAPEEDLIYLRQNFNLIDTSLDLVLDQRLMDIALSAFGLPKDTFGSNFVVNAIISDPTDPNAFVNVLNDDRWVEFATIFGAGASSRGNTGLQSFQDQLVTQYEERVFELSIGEVDQNMRLALNFRREIVDLANSPLTSDDTHWLAVVGDGPLRTVLDAALGLPEQFSQLDIEDQVTVYRDRAQAIFGSSEVSLFLTPESVETAIQRFLASTGATGAPAGGLGNSPAANALTLLQNSATLAGGGQFNITV